MTLNLFSLFTFPPYWGNQYINNKRKATNFHQLFSFSWIQIKISNSKEFQNPGSVIVIGDIFACFTFCYRTKKKRQIRSMYFQQNGGLLIKQYIDGCSIIQTRFFSSFELNRATKNYNKKWNLGSGGNDSVYSI